MHFKIMFLPLAISLFLFSCGNRDRIKTKSFDNIEAQTKALNENFQSIKSTKGKGRRKLEKKYLQAFPETWQNYSEIFGNNGPLYGQFDYLYLLDELNSFDKEIVYRKVFDFSIGGTYGKNTEQDLLLHVWFFKDPYSMCQVCMEYTDDEIESAFLFMLDRGHPGWNASKFEELYKLIEKENVGLAKLFSHAYNQLLKNIEKNPHRS